MSRAEESVAPAELLVINLLKSLKEIFNALVIRGNLRCA